MCIFHCHRCIAKRNFNPLNRSHWVTIDWLFFAVDLFSRKISRRFCFHCCNSWGAKTVHVPLNQRSKSIFDLFPFRFWQQLQVLCTWTTFCRFAHIDLQTDYHRGFAFPVLVRTEEAGLIYGLSKQMVFIFPSWHENSSGFPWHLCMEDSIAGIFFFILQSFSHILD